MKNVNIDSSATAIDDGAVKKSDVSNSLACFHCRFISETGLVSAAEQAKALFEAPGAPEAAPPAAADKKLG